jgi:hypothetical protein
LPDAETFVPELGLCLPPDVLLDFGCETSSNSEEEDYALDPSQDVLLTPLSRADFNLPDYDTLLSDGGTGFGDASDGFTNQYDQEDDDILRNADDGADLDFNLDSTPLHPKKRGLREDGNDPATKRMRFNSGEGTDDEIQRIAREDHDLVQQPHMSDWSNDIGGFGDPAFTEYQTPPTIADEQSTVNAPVKKKSGRVIVEDKAATIKDAEFRLWPQRYREMQTIRKERGRLIEMGKIAKANAAKLVWGWGGRSEGHLPPALSQMFSREALLKRWAPAESHPATPGKRKRNETDVEYALGFGDGGFGDQGGFDYSVSHEIFPADLRQRKLLVTPMIWRPMTPQSNYCKCHGTITHPDRPHDKRLRIYIPARPSIPGEAGSGVVSLVIADSTITTLHRVLLFHVEMRSEPQILQANLTLKLIPWKKSLGIFAGLFRAVEGNNQIYSTISRRKSG